MRSSFALLSVSLLSELTRPCDLNRDIPTAQIKQELVFTGTETGKLLALRQHLANGSVIPPILVFVQSIERATSLFHELIYDALPIEVIHSERTPKERERVLKDFREGKVWVLICTELMGRGMDFKGIRAVVNYDFPTSVQSYVHRIGSSTLIVTATTGLWLTLNPVRLR